MDDINDQLVAGAMIGGIVVLWIVVRVIDVGMQAAYEGPAALGEFFVELFILLALVALTAKLIEEAAESLV